MEEKSGKLQTANERLLCNTNENLNNTIQIEFYTHLEIKKIYTIQIKQVTTLFKKNICNTNGKLRNRKYKIHMKNSTTKI